MLYRVGVRSLVATLALVVFASAAWADDIPWAANDSGANARFGWSGGEYQTGKYGIPDVDTAGFHFNNPIDFRADETVSTAVDQLDVRVDVDLAVPAGAAPLPFIRVVEHGRWYAPGATSYGWQVNVGASTSLTGVRPSPGITNPPHALAVTYHDIDADLGYGLWEAEYTYWPDELNDPPEDQPWIEVVITVDNVIQWWGVTGAWIEKDGVDIYVPEPGTAILILAGAFPLILRRVRR